MAEFAASVLAPSLETALKHVGAAIKRQFIYLFCFTSNIAGLEGEAKQLDDAIQGVQNKVDHEATNNARAIHHDATSWFQFSNELISKKNRIINEVPNVRGGCLKLAARFSLSRRAKKTSEAMAQHREKSKHLEISQPPSTAAIKEIPLGKTFSFSSRKKIEQDIMIALRDKKENMIAIHGMGGLGKTTMAFKIMNALLHEKLFDEIVIAVVSQKVDELKIQLDISGSLGLNDLNSESAPQDRVRKLHDRLSADTRRTLLLLDDVWEELKLENLGIPRDSKGCTILITSRNSDALREMGVEKIFEMEKLSEKDAWLMFSEKAGTCVDDKNLRSIAEEVAKECGGLPIALHVLGASLHNEKSKGVWKDTLKMLKMPNPGNTTRCIEKAYMPLIVSYEKLDEKFKSPFLLCCLFPEDENISMKRMTYFCMGLRLFKDLGSLEDAKGKMSLVVKTLKDRSLLLDGCDENHVRMHDVVRDVCIFIAKEKGYIGGMDCSWISHIQRPTGIEPSTELGFPKLRLLFSDDKEFNIDIFFEGMKELYVLYIKNYSWKSLPHTRSLCELRTLVLDRCRYVETLSAVGDLVNLEVLICRRCIEIKDLPQDMRRLKHLKVLDLTGCRKLQSIGRGIISSLVELEELKMLWSFDRWDAIGLSELQELTTLTCLKIQIADPLLVDQEINLSSKLERFEIRFGHDYSTSFPKTSTKNMVLCWDEETCLGYWVKKLLKEAESLCFSLRLRNLLRILGKWTNKLDFPNYFPNIRSLKLKELGIKSIETTSMENDDGVATMFPQMDMLELSDLPCLESICKCPISSISFQNLKKLKLYRLPALKKLWKSNTVMSFPQLEDIEIIRCELMEQLFVWSEEDEYITSCVGSSNHDVSKTQGVAFPLLQRVWVKDCPKMRSLVPTPLNRCGDHSSHLFCQSQRVSFGSLKTLKIEWNPFCHHKSIDTSFFNQLESLCISKYDGSMSLFVLSVAINLGNLKELKIKDCDEMVSVIEDDKEEGEVAVSIGAERNRRLFPNLEILRLTRLGKLVSFSNFKNDVEVPSLEKVVISGCPNMSNLSLATHTLKIKETDHCNLLKVPFSKNENPPYNLHQTRIFSFVDGLQELTISRYLGSAAIFSSSVAEHLVSLTKLRIGDCEKMVKVIEGGERSSTRLFPKLKILNLSNLLKLEMFCESGVELPLLEDLTIWKCHNITEFTYGPNSSISFQNLKKLRLYRLPALKQLWKSNSAPMSLPQLEDIEIQECEMMEYLFMWSEEDESISNQVTRTQGVAFPLLQSVYIRDCPKMRSLVPTPLNGYGDHYSHLFCQPQEVSFGSLKTLDIEWNPFCHHNSIDTSFFNQLEKLRISKYDGSMGLFVLSVAINLGNLKELEINDCDEMVSVIEDDKEEGEVAVSTGAERNRRLFPNLKILQLFCLGKLVSFSNLKNDVELPSLEKVFIFWCPIMSSLSLPTRTLKIIGTDNCNFFKVPFSKNENPPYNLHQTRIFSFDDGLQELTISHCQGSASIFSSSVAEHLVSLTKLDISDCENMVKVIEGGERSSTRLFPKLKILKLSDLLKLEMFCEWEGEVELPLLEELIIKKCPNITKFTLGSVSTPCLESVSIDEMGYEVDASRDLNSVLASANEKENNSEYDMEIASGDETGDGKRMNNEVNK